MSLIEKQEFKGFKEQTDLSLCAVCKEQKDESVMSMCCFCCADTCPECMPPVGFCCRRAFAANAAEDFREALLGKLGAAVYHEPVTLLELVNCYWLRERSTT